jgi:hypothetical protein
MESMIRFDPANREHKAIVVSAMAAADAFGTGRLTAAREQLELNDIRVRDEREFLRYVFAWGQGI